MIVWRRMAEFRTVTQARRRGQPRAPVWSVPGFGESFTAHTLYQKQQPNLAWWSNNIWGKFYRVDHDCWRAICLRQLKILVHAAVPPVGMYTLWRRGYWSCRRPSVATKCKAEHMYTSAVRK